jgi:phage FluMu protein Com
MANEKVDNSLIEMEERRCSNTRCNKLFFKIKGAIIGLLEVKCSKCKLTTTFKK